MAKGTSSQEKKKPVNHNGFIKQDSVPPGSGTTNRKTKRRWGRNIQPQYLSTVKEE